MLLNFLENISQIMSKWFYYGKVYYKTNNYIVETNAWCAFRNKSNFILFMLMYKNRHLSERVMF